MCGSSEETGSENAISEKGTVPEKEVGISPLHRCLKCGHEWKGRKYVEQKPRKCPKCQYTFNPKRILRRSPDKEKEIEILTYMKEHTYRQTTEHFGITRGQLHYSRQRAGIDHPDLKEPREISYPRKRKVMKNRKKWNKNKTNFALGNEVEAFAQNSNTRRKGKQFKPIMISYLKLIQADVEQLIKNQQEKCTVFCHPIGVVCQEICESLKLNNAVFNDCKVIIQAMMTEGWFQELLGYSRVSVAAAITYIASIRKRQKLTQRVMCKAVGNNDTTLRAICRKITNLGNIAIKPPEMEEVMECPSNQP